MKLKLLLGLLSLVTASVTRGLAPSSNWEHTSDIAAGAHTAVHQYVTMKRRVAPFEVEYSIFDDGTSVLSVYKTTPGCQFYDQRGGPARVKDITFRERIKKNLREMIEKGLKRCRLDRGSSFLVMSGFDENYALLLSSRQRSFQFRKNGS